ncbi:hypothetical protein CMV_008153 [Castanea mollissima]|uniref:Wall-associated receptor kinase domain-containing protein n=1 Tax=Castanea mollissima TaxID=60419 RepID=A0A8J4VPK7_9ROSI|nr:hypothetical protein CMV_008153 [Castanea mollissima]
MSCDNLPYLLSNDSSLVFGGCMSVCEKDAIKTNGSSCNGVDCCQTTIPSNLEAFTIRIQSMIELSPFERTKDCKYASLAYQKWFKEKLTNHFEVRKMSYVPVELNWEIYANLSSLVMGINSSHSTCQFANRSSSLGNMSSTFSCSCDSGFEGNPYLVDGCQDRYQKDSSGNFTIEVNLAFISWKNHDQAMFTSLNSMLSPSILALTVAQKSAKGVRKVLDASVSVLDGLPLEHDSFSSIISTCSGVLSIEELNILLNIEERSIKKRSGNIDANSMAMAASFKSQGFSRGRGGRNHKSKRKRSSRQL